MIELHRRSDVEQYEFALKAHRELLAHHEKHAEEIEAFNTANEERAAAENKRRKEHHKRLLKAREDAAEVPVTGPQKILRMVKLRGRDAAQALGPEPEEPMMMEHVPVMPPPAPEPPEEPPVYTAERYELPEGTDLSVEEGFMRLGGDEGPIVLPGMWVVTAPDGGMHAVAHPDLPRQYVRR